MTKATDLLTAYDNLDWDVYIALSEDLTHINEVQIDDELSKQATLFSYYSGLYEYAKRDSEITEVELTKCQAEARIKGQAECEAAGTRPTVAVLDSFVNTDEFCAKITLSLIETKYKLGLLKSLMQSLSHKKDCLIQLSANQRDEKKIYS
tara:strand:+ start:115 stop:564 length:450 start_codon:yes stop_codon:yes gene_type:complete